MIGQNDAPTDRLDTDGARRLVDQASRRGVTRFSMWSLNRDLACTGNLDPAIVNPSCSGVEQERLEFSTIFGAVAGRATGAVPVEEENGPSGRIPVVETNGTGPYDDWRPRREYEMAAKVVWRGQVYEAKWWNVAAPPDAPVENEWDSPWRILGPVLATDRPVVSITLVKLPEGTFPAWTSRVAYEAGDRVQHLGVAYRAKWWTQGDDPTEDVDNSWQSSWEPLPASAIPSPDADAPEPGPSDEVAVPALPD
jgi:chitinase